MLNNYPILYILYKKSFSVYNIQRMSKLTINEIAKMANVAKSTVSKALNGQKGVSDEVRQKILSLVADVNYQPNATARALAQNKTGIIGFVLPHSASTSLTEKYWIEIITSITEEVELKGNNLMVIAPSSNADDPYESLRNIVLRQSVDGLIMGAENLNSEIMDLIQKSGIPFVFIGQNPLYPHFSIDVNNEEGAYLVTKEIIKHLGDNQKKLCCITGPKEYIYTKDRIHGFIRACTEENYNKNYIFSTDYSSENTQKTVLELLDACPNPDAFFIAAGGDFFLSIMDILRLEGLNIKTQVLGVFDDARIFDFLDFSIISAKQPLQQIGQLAAKILFDLMLDKQPENQVQYLSVNIILR